MSLKQIIRNCHRNDRDRCFVWNVGSDFCLENDRPRYPEGHTSVTYFGKKSSWFHLKNIRAFCLKKNSGHLSYGPIFCGSWSVPSHSPVWNNRAGHFWDVHSNIKVTLLMYGETYGASYHRQADCLSHSKGRGKLRNTGPLWWESIGDLCWIPSQRDSDAESVWEHASRVRCPWSHLSRLRKRISSWSTCSCVERLLP